MADKPLSNKDSDELSKKKKSWLTRFIERLAKANKNICCN